MTYDDESGPVSGPGFLTHSLGLPIERAAQAPTAAAPDPFPTTGLGCDLSLEFKYGAERYRVVMDTIHGTPKMYRLSAGGEPALCYHNYHFERVMMQAREYLLLAAAFLPERRPVSHSECFVENPRKYRPRKKGRV